MSSRIASEPIVWWKAAAGIVAVALLAEAVPNLGAMLALAFIRLLRLPVTHGGNLPWLYWQHAGQFVVALVAIAVVRRLVPTDYGLHPPRGRSYVGAAVAWGVVFGVLMTVVDYWPSLMGGTRPDAGFPLTPRNVGGWLVFEGVYVGPTEEVPFRALLVPLLMALFPARLRIGRFDMAWAGLIVAVLFALLHASSFATQPLAQALGQQVYAFALGVLYAYWLEKSGSIVAPIVGHNVSDVVEYLLLFGWIALP